MCCLWLSSVPCKLLHRLQRLLLQLKASVPHNRRGPVPPAPRRYTLTHNDLTGELQLSVGACYNTAQISSWYNRLIRCAAAPRALCFSHTDAHQCGQWGMQQSWLEL